MLLLLLILSCHQNFKTSQCRASNHQMVQPIFNHRGYRFVNIRCIFLKALFPLRQAAQLTEPKLFTAVKGRKNTAEVFL